MGASSWGNDDDDDGGDDDEDTVLLCTCGELAPESLQEAGLVKRAGGHHWQQSSST